MIWIFFLPIVTTAQRDLTAVTKGPGWVMVGRYRKLPIGDTEEYLGIPYALPPVGRHRFHKPHPILEFPKYFEAFEYKPCCHPVFLESQRYMSVYPNIFGNNTLSEDCLYLNIWATTDRNTPLKPVMFWIHGGGWVSGCASSTYQGSLLSTYGVVVVTINYRLGSLGFLSAGTEEAPGNMGLYDQLLALKWVRQNIRYFGGDGRQITIFGESAGGISVSALVTSKKAVGLFKRAIIQSGTPNIPVCTGNKKDSIDGAHLLSQIVGCNEDGGTIYDNPDLILSCLRTVPAKKILNGDYRLARLRGTFHRFNAIYDEEFLNYTSFYPLEPSHINDKDIMIGLTADEAIGVYYFMFPEFYKKGNFPPTYRTLIESFEEFFKFPQAHDIANFYFNKVPKNNIRKVHTAFVDLLTDFLFFCPTIYFADMLANRGNKVYFFYFTYATKKPYLQFLPGRLRGAFHFDDVIYSFGMPILVPQYFTRAEIKFSREMMGVWTGFAKSGNPNNTGDKVKFDKPILWEKFTPKNGSIFELHPKNYQNLKPVPHLNQCNHLWKAYFKHGPSKV